MCCDGTVATSCGRVPFGHRSPSASRFCAVLVRKLRQVFGLGLGSPVLPEVKPIATSASSSMRQRAARLLGKHIGQAPVMRRRIGEQRVADAVALGMAAQFVGDDRGRARRRQQRRLAAHGDRAERHQEPVAILAEVDRVPTGRQHRRHATHLREELAEADLAVAVEHDGAVMRADGERRRRRDRAGLDDC